MSNNTLYERLGGYDVISAVVNELLPRLREAPLLAHYWQAEWGGQVEVVKQLLIDFLCSSAGGPLYYTGRDMKTSHKGVGISDSDGSVSMRHLHATLEVFQVPQAERHDLPTFFQSTKTDMVEA